MMFRQVSWWIAVSLLVGVGLMIRLDSDGSAATSRVSLQATLWDGGVWQCEATLSAKPAYEDPVAETAWSGVCRRDDRTALSVYVGYVGAQGHQRKLASPRLHYPGGDERWSYVVGRPREIPPPSKNRPPLRVNETVLQHSDGRKDAVLYWYQRGVHTYADEFRFRAALIMQGLTRNPTDAAVIRMAMPLDERGMDAAFQPARELAPTFYSELAARVPWR